mgnify:CR=1 FL=1
MAKNQGGNNQKPNTTQQPNAEQVNDQSAPAPATAPDGAAPAVGDAPATPLVTDKQLEEGNAEAASLLFRAAQPLAVLIIDGVVSVQPLIDSLTELLVDLPLPDGVPTPEELAVSLVGPVTRYIEQAKFQEADLDSIQFVIADPATDRILKSINFMRSMQGLGPTYIYPEVV